ncbi:aldo/keto reductase [Rhodococcus sp. 05-340-1]|uniref:aldo/keto reductase n=1 Tax=unclassified Rhodococcus (in: high G+C Gram-positive bacteria) TaxID=192944 RepID=UPI000B9A21C1|nr:MULTISPECIES: aldo/keto reductase [unclassified Rhodococcus (in: high G+C Gram-positive bacteria)]OZD73245.1 aldo/keto reductase [Rhodococcus sp. 05-340-2]OZD75367.1 aldo/keto reductase [Rhodococcus sp. 05-340-1]
MTRMDEYRLLGRSGLRVSPLSLGAMTFGDAWGWGADEDDSRRIFDAYLDAGGNMVDTANIYTDGQSERYLGRFLRGRRDSVVVATKYAATRDPSDPNAGGGGRKSLRGSVEASLKNLGTDYIDLLYLHAWDGMTPSDEIIASLGELVRSGKVLYLGVSDTPAWEVARMNTTAELRGWPSFASLQVEYSLIERTTERELLPMAADLGLGVIPWAPLGGGVLTGKYSAADLATAGSDSPSGTRRDHAKANGTLTIRGLDIAKVVVDVAHQLGVSAAQVALAWTLRNPSVTSSLIGARTVEQLSQNISALDVVFDESQLDKLHAVSAVDLGFPHEFLTRPMVRGVTTGRTSTRPRPNRRW